jgi:uncharacterized protein (TIGR02452 family)
VRRTTRAGLAHQTLAIIERGSYEPPTGGVVEIASAVKRCLEGTRFYSPEELERVRRDVLSCPPGLTATAFEVVNETTLAGLARTVSSGGGLVAALNFASAKNPGGGFLRGSHAQEESLARSSALYASLLRAGEYYERHRASPTLLCSDAMILSPSCPVFRDDDGRLLDEPCLATFITSAAPNAGAMSDHRRDESSQVPDVFRKRSEYVLALAASQGYKRLVLGAWGCGVFRNDPGIVADAFSAHLRRGAWADRFERVIFSVLDSSSSQATFAAFRRAFGLDP